MDKIEKALKKLSNKERETIGRILNEISRSNLDNLDIKKLKGHKDIFRARSGAIRIIFRITHSQIFILAIERRSDAKYNL